MHYCIGWLKMFYYYYYYFYYYYYYYYYYFYFCTSELCKEDTIILQLYYIVFYHLHAPPPDRSMPLQWLAPQFGMASLCRYAHSLESFLRHSFLNLRRFYLVVLVLGAPLSSPT